MKRNVALTVTSLLSVILFAFHWSDEISRGMERGTLSSFGGIVILAVWLSGVLVFGNRLSGYIISLLGGILGLGVLVIHMSGRGMVGGRIAPDSAGVYFWVLTLVALGVTSTISAILAAGQLWSLISRNRQR